MSYLGFKERYEEAVRRSTIIYRKVMQLIGDSDGDFVKLLNIFRVMRDCMVSCINKEGDPLSKLAIFRFILRIFKPKIDSHSAAVLDVLVHDEQPHKR